MKKKILAEYNAALFPIVGIGASAGGLEAFEQFLGNVPEKSGMAFVIIQHLDPTQKGMLPELLQRITPMKVFQAKERMIVLSNCVYVIPPNKSLSISNGILHLSEPIEERGLRLPVNYFFQSLAEDRREQSVGIILSGMGSDGSLGVRAIKERNGIVMVQDPATAKYGSMPRNAMDAVMVDVVALAKDLPKRILDYFKIPIIKPSVERDSLDNNALEEIFVLLHQQTGNDFSLYKKNTIHRRIERRMLVYQLDSITAYVQLLQNNASETTLLYKELLIGVTNFFRDPTVWETLQEKIFPRMIENQPFGATIRVWIPGCSTGEEAYSMAIAFKEVLEKINPHSGVSMQLFATDIDNEAIEIARKGCYPSSIITDVSQERLKRFFFKTKDGYHINSDIRNMIVFAQHNIIMHPPFTKLHLLSCRNLLIYLDAELQKKIIRLFYYSLCPQGYLVLGNSETVGSQNHLFANENVKQKIFQRTQSSKGNLPIDITSSFPQQNHTVTDRYKSVELSTSIETFTNQFLLQHYTPPCVLVNELGDIIFTTKRTGKYLEPAVGKANLNIFAMLREGLRKDFPPAFHKVITTKEMVVLHNINVETNIGSTLFSVTIQWVEKPELMNGMVIIIFIDTPNMFGIEPKIKNKVSTKSNLLEPELEEEIKRTNEEMFKLFDEMQISQEELKSNNEELQSTNEELQSTNEELTSSKEEIQSLNEELQTVIVELQAKVEIFSSVNNDMKNLLNSTEIAMLFLDKELKIRRYTNQATQIFKLIKSDVGRPLTDLVSDLIDNELWSDAHEVLKTLVFIKKQVPTKDGRWFSIQIMPYRTYDEKVDGLVITFFNITDLKQLEDQLYKTALMHRSIFNASSDIICHLSPNLTILALNPKAEIFFGKTLNELLNQSFIQHCIPESAQKETELTLKKLEKTGAINHLSFPVITPTNITVVKWAVHILRDKEDKNSTIVLINT